MNIVYQVEKISDILEELKPLLEDHYEEVAIYKDKIKLNPDYKRYLELEELGMLHTVTGREDEKIVSYFISFLSPNLHYSDHLYALNDVLYVKPEYRHTKASYDLFWYAEQELRKMDVSVIVIHMKTSFPFEGLAQKLGYDKIEYNYSKYVGK